MTANQRIDAALGALGREKTAIGGAIRLRGGTVAAGDGFGDFAAKITALPARVYTTGENGSFMFRCTKNTVHHTVSIDGFSDAGLSDAAFDRVNMVIASRYCLDGEWYTVSKIGDSAFTGRNGTMAGGSAYYEANGKIETVVLPETVTEIGSNAFSGDTYHTSLTSVSGCDHVTKIGDWAFCKTGLLETLSFPEVVTIGTGAFSYSGVIEVTLGSTEDGVLSAVQVIPRGCFLYCDRLRKVLGHFELTSIGSCAFANCYLLDTFDISPSETAHSLTIINAYAFSYCGLDVTVPSNTSTAEKGTRGYIYGSKSASDYIYTEGENRVEQNYVFYGAKKKNGVTIIYNGDGTFTVTGKLDSGLNAPYGQGIKLNIPVTAGTYVLSGVPSDTDKIDLRLTVQPDTAGGNTYTFAEDTTVNMSIGIFGTWTESKTVTVTPSLTKTLTRWDDCIDGKEFAFGSGVTKTVNGVSFTNNGDGTITASGTATAGMGTRAIFAPFDIDSGTYDVGCVPADNTGLFEIVLATVNGQQTTEVEKTGGYYVFSDAAAVGMVIKFEGPWDDAISDVIITPYMKKYTEYQGDNITVDGFVMNKTSSQNGITVTNNYDGTDADATFTLNGTASADVSCKIKQDITLAAGRYMISGVGSKQKNIRLSVKENTTEIGRENGERGEFTLTAEKTVSVYIEVKKDVALSNAVVTPKLTALTVRSFTPCDLSKILKIADGANMAGSPYAFTAQTVAGVTVTPTASGITLSGTTSGTQREIAIKSNVTLKPGRYAMTGIPAASGSKCQLVAKGADGTVLMTDSGSGDTLTVYDRTVVFVCLRIAGAVNTFSDVTVTPSFRESCVSYAQHCRAWLGRKNCVTCSWHAFSAGYDILKTKPYTAYEVNVIQEQNDEYINIPGVVQGNLSDLRIYWYGAKTIAGVKLSAETDIRSALYLNDIVAALEAGKPVMLFYWFFAPEQGTGFPPYQDVNDSTHVGHATLIYGIDADGNFMISDSNSMLEKITGTRTGGCVRKISPFHMLSVIRVSEDLTQYPRIRTLEVET